MAQTNLADYKNLYLQTAKEYLEKMSVSLNQLSNDVSNKEALNNLHIASHSLKSQSQVMGFKDISDICLNIEKISDEALRGNAQLNNQIITDVKKSVENLSEILKLIQDDTGAKV